MRQHAIGRNLVPGCDTAAERSHGGNLPSGKIRIAVVVPRIGDLDPDRMRVDVVLA